MYEICLNLSIEDNYPTRKSNCDGYLLPYYFDSCRIYMFGWIWTWRWGPWCLWCGRQICRIHILWILHLVQQTRMLSRACDDAYWVTSLIVLNCKERGIGYSPAVYLLDIMWGQKAITPHCWDLPSGHIITWVGRWCLQPKVYPRWKQQAFVLVIPWFNLIYHLPLCMQWRY